MRLLLACLALLLTANAAAQIYRWTDEKGRVVYGNEPPAGAKPDVVQDRTNSYGGPPGTGPPPPGAAAAPPPPPTVPGVLYATAWCPYRAQGPAHFPKKGGPHIEDDVEETAAAHSGFKP